MLRKLTCAALVLGLLIPGLLGAGCTPSPGAGPSLALVRAAEREGALNISANAGEMEAGPLLDAFQKAHPGIAIHFTRENSAELYDHYLADSRAAKPKVDLVWSSAMDLQIKLINDGYAQTYAPTEKAALPTWAVWKDQGYGVTAEPIVFVYDRRKLDPAKAPQSHAQLRRMLEAHEIPGAMATFDPQRSGVGFLYYSQDLQEWSDTMALNRAMGTSAPKLYESTATLLDGLASGDAVIAYNVIGSYAMERQHNDPNLRVVFPTDYTLVASRIAFVSKGAPHPNAAKIFLDFMLSSEGQRLLAQTSLTPVRTDLKDGAPRAAEAVARPIRVGPSLLANLDQMRRARLLADWRSAIGPKRVDDLRRVRDNR